MPLLSTHIFKKFCSFLRFLIYLHRCVEILVFLLLLRQKAPLPCAESGAFFNLFLSGCGKPGAVLVLLIGGDHDLQPAHVRLQHFGDGHTAVGLQMVLQEGDQHTRRCHTGVVQGVGQISLAVLALDADVQAACLCVTQIGAGADLEVLLLAGAPSLDIAALDLQSARSPEQQFSWRTGISMLRNSSTDIFHSFSYQSALSSGRQTTIISCFSNWWMR